MPRTSTGAAIFLSLVLLAFSAVPLAPAQDAPNPQDAAAAGGEAQQPAPAAPTGPMRLEPIVLYETRVWYGIEPPGGAGPTSTLRLQVKLTGERLAQVVRSGPLVIEEAVDEHGNTLVDAEAMGQYAREMTLPVNVNARVLQQGFLPREANLVPPPRSSTKIARMRGYCNIVFADKSEQVVIENPLQYEGREVDHPRLKELGIELRVLKIGEEADEPGGGKGIAMKFTGGEEKVRAAELYDAWMKRMAVRARVGQTNNEKKYTYYAAQVGKIDEDTQLVLHVFPEIETARVSLMVDDLALP